MQQHKLTDSIRPAVSHPRRHVRYHCSLWTRRRRPYLASSEPDKQPELIHVWQTKEHGSGGLVADIENLVRLCISQLDSRSD